MSTFREIENRLRAGRPDIEVQAPPLASVLVRIEQTSHPARGRGSWRRRGVVLPIAVGVLVLAAASAGGALLLASGKPVAPAFVLPATPETGLGEPVGASLAPLPMRVPDPVGGPPWGMRVIRTTRGLVCLQAGRVVDGALGALGSGYAFGGDGRFHPYLPADAIATDSCPVVGTGVSPILPGPPVIVPASGLPLAGENVSETDQEHCDLPGQQDWGVRCPQAELRQVAMGLLGPDAKSIQVATPEGSFTVAPYGPDGAYLFVLQAQANANTSMSSGAYQGPFGYVSKATGGVVLSVTYGDGFQCQIPANDASRQCHAQKPGGSGSQLPNAAQLSSTVHVSYMPREGHPVASLLVADATGSTFAATSGVSGQAAPGPALTVNFSAPVSADSASSAYVVELKPKPVSGCATPAVIVSQPTNQTLEAGAPVKITVPLETTCTTTYTGRVFFASSSTVGGESGGEGPLYEAIAAHYGPPGTGRNPMSFPTVGSFQVSVP
jgi:hypothetical protein